MISYRYIKLHVEIAIFYLTNNFQGNHVYHYNKLFIARELYVVPMLLQFLVMYVEISNTGGSLTLLSFYYIIINF